MHTFCQIIHKDTCESNELYNFCTIINKPTNIDFISNEQSNRSFLNTQCYNFYKIVHDYEFKTNTDISYDDDLSNRLIKSILFIYEMSYVDYSIQSKFSYYKKTIDNIFISVKQCEEFINRFCRIQRIYWTLNKAVYNYKLKKAPYRIQKDLILNPINNQQHNVITIMQNNNKYLFTVFDLRSIIEIALTNSSYMFSNPLPPKNPYNNLPFDKAILYKIYFFMKRGNFVLSNLFHNYFLCNFNLTKFKNENEVIIRKKYLDQYVKNSCDTDLHKEVIYMLRKNRFSRFLKIDKLFPVNKLVNILRPYLLLYYYKLYSLDSAERDNVDFELDILLRRFYDFNPKFGRKYLKRNNGNNGNNGNYVNVYFNDEHIKFQRLKCRGEYRDSHLEVVEQDRGVVFVEVAQRHIVLSNYRQPDNNRHNEYDESEESEESDDDGDEESHEYEENEQDWDW
jgi:hypothetical protein